MQWSSRMRKNYSTSARFWRTRLSLSGNKLDLFSTLVPSFIFFRSFFRKLSSRAIDDHWDRPRSLANEFRPSQRRWSASDFRLLHRARGNLPPNSHFLPPPAENVLRGRRLHFTFGFRLRRRNFSRLTFRAHAKIVNENWKCPRTR